MEVDYLAVSFPRSGADLNYARELAREAGCNAKIVAKVERAETVATDEAMEDIIPLAQYNIDKVMETAEKITELCQEALCFEAILQKLFTHYHLTMNFEQYVLVGSTVRSYLSWLKDTGRLTARFENNMLLWQRV